MDIYLYICLFIYIYLSTYRQIKNAVLNDLLTQRQVVQVMIIDLFLTMKNIRQYNS